MPRRLRADDDARTVKPADLGCRADHRDLGGKGRALQPFSMVAAKFTGRTEACSRQQRFGLGLIVMLPLIFYQRQLATNRHVRRGLLLMGFLVTLAVFFTYSRGALVGVCAMGVVFWLRSRAKFTTGLLIAALAFSIYSVAPEKWFNRMGTIETYQDDGSAMSRSGSGNFTSDCRASSDQWRRLQGDLFAECYKQHAARHRFGQADKTSRGA